MGLRDLARQKSEELQKKFKAEEEKANQKAAYEAELKTVTPHPLCNILKGQKKIDYVVGLLLLKDEIPPQSGDDEKLWRRFAMSIRMAPKNLEKLTQKAQEMSQSSESFMEQLPFKLLGLDQNKENSFLGALTSNVALPSNYVIKDVDFYQKQSLCFLFDFYRLHGIYEDDFSDDFKDFWKDICIGIFKFSPPKVDKMEEICSVLCERKSFEDAISSLASNFMSGMGKETVLMDADEKLREVATYYIDGAYLAEHQGNNVNLEDFDSDIEEDENDCDFPIAVENKAKKR